MNKDAQVQQIVAEVLKKLLPQLGADGTRGRIVVVLTAATVAFGEAMRQVRSLVLNGFRVQLVFSDSAEHLYGAAARDELQGFPHLLPFDASRWLRELKEARAVVVPLLSVNTLSKLSLLIADNLPTNLLLHGLLLGKPVITAQNGVDPTEAGRAELGFNHGSPSLARAIAERLQTISSYGCLLTDIASLSSAVESALAKDNASPGQPHPVVNGPPAMLNYQNAKHHRKTVITSADVLHAFRSGSHHVAQAGATVTPLARELATKYGVSLSQDRLVNV